MITSSVHLEFDVPGQRYRVVCDTDFLADYDLDTSSVPTKLLGTIYFNGDIDQQHITAMDPLIDLSAGTVSAWYPLPLDSSDEIVNGTWTGDGDLNITGTNVQFTSITVPTTILTDGSHYLLYFLEAGDELTLTAGTPQDVLVASVADADPNVTITTSTTILSDVHDGIDFDLTHDTFTLSHTYTGCNEVEASVSAASDCDSTEFGTFTGYDSTDYGSQTISSTTLRIQHPSWTIQPYSTVDSVTTASAPTGPISKTLTQLYTGTWTARLDSTVTYTQSDGLVVVYTITKTHEEPVTCAGTLCGLQPCIENLRASVAADFAAYGNSKNEIHLLNVLTYSAQATNYKICGDLTNYRLMIANIEAELDSSGCDCSCCDTDQLIRVMNVSEDVATAITNLEAALQWRLFDGIPGVDQDSTLGVQVGAVWKDINSPGIAYQCTDNTAGAAVWTEYYNPAGSGASDKVYVATVTQTGTSNPILTVGKNSGFTGAITIARTSQGLYTITSADSEFTGSGKTIPTIQYNKTNSNVYSFAMNRINTTSIVIVTRDETGAVVDAALTNTPLVITVYS